MTEPDYKQILKNQDTISQLSLEDVQNLQRLLFKREIEIKGKEPEYHILDDPDNIRVSKQKVIENMTPRVQYLISVNQEAVTDHKNLWRQWCIDNEYIKEENIDNYMNSLILRWMEQRLQECYEDKEPRRKDTSLAHSFSTSHLRKS